MPLPAAPSALVSALFLVTSVLAVALLTLGIRRGGASPSRFLGVVVAWMALTAGAGASGVLAHFDPPRLPPFLLLALVGVVLLVRSEEGKALAANPLGWIVGFQGFRVLVEIGIHQAAVEGIAPMEMSWSGWNFDVVTGVVALVLAPFAQRVPTAALHAFNALGVALLAAVVGTALLAMPSPFQQIVTDPPNVWVAHFPFIWLPTILVASALVGHGVLWRRLRSEVR